MLTTEELAAIKIGDEFAYPAGSFGRTTRVYRHRVTRFTPTQIVTTMTSGPSHQIGRTMRFRRDSGRRVGDGGDLIRWTDAHTRINLEARFLDSIGRINSGEARRMSDEELRAICAILRNARERIESTG